MNEHSTKAESYDAWFRAQVERALGEADDATKPRMAHEFVELKWRKRRADLNEIAVKMNGR